MSRRHRPSRKLTWIAFFAAALSVTVAQQQQAPLADTEAPVVPTEKPVPEEPSQDVEANKAFNQALRTIRILNAIPPSQQAAYHVESSSPQPNAFLMSLFPNQDGPIASLIRLAYRLRYDTPSWVARRFGGRTGRRREEIRGRAAKVIDLLEHASDLGHEDAMYTLAEVSLFPPPALPRNVSRAFDYYSRHAELTGNATSQAMLGFFHATGYDGVTEVDQAQALLHYSFAALAGSRRAEMVMGYRHWAGISVNEDCMTALGWYEAAAEKSIVTFLGGPPGGRTLPSTATRLSDIDGGAYGPGASVASTGRDSVRAVIKAASSRAAGETWEDVLEYYQYHADRGEIDFAYRLGKIYYHGSVYTASGGAASGAEGVGVIGRDFVRARAYFISITRLVWPSTNIKFPLLNKRQVEERVGITAAMAAGYLGRMHLRGEGVRQDYRMAKMWFERGAEYGDRECQMGLGLLHRDGLLDGKGDLAKAVAYFTTAAGQDLAEAQVQLGKYHYDMGDNVRATMFFESAIRHGSPFEAYYWLAEMHSNQAHDPQMLPTTRAGSCAIAVSFYKLVAERGSWDDDLVGDAERLWDFNGIRTGVKSSSTRSRSNDGPVRAREKETAKLKWWVAAESGSEVAQNNLAYLLDQDRSALRHTRLITPPSNETARLALTQWSRSAAQRNVDALVKVGDYYYHGLGVEDEPQETRWEKAAGYYHRAVETQMSALAMWNLGWMYENGVGVVQDFHLAKRYYDMALETNVEAYLPVTLALIKLYLRSFWYSFTGGTEKTLILWGDDDAEDDHWYLGKAKAEFKKRWSGDAQAQIDGENVDDGTGTYPDDEDSVSWARDRKREELERAQAEHDADGGFGPDDYFDSAINHPGRRGENFDRDDAVDDLIFMLVLCGILGFLIYMRTRWVPREQERLRQEAQAREQANQQPQVPPPQ